MLLFTLNSQLKSFNHMFLFVLYWRLLKIMKFETCKIPTRKNLGLTKYRENILDPRNTYEKKFWTNECTAARWHKTHDGMRLAEFSTFHATKWNKNIRNKIKRISVLMKNSTIISLYLRDYTCTKSTWISNSLWYTIERLLKVRYGAKNLCENCRELRFSRE